MEHLDLSSREDWDKIDDDQIRDIVMTRLLEAGVAMGAIDLDGKDDLEAKAQVAGFVNNLVSDEVEVCLTVDFRDELLEEAGRKAADGSFQLAALLYATWMEHWINGIIVNACSRCGVGEANTKAMLRDIPLRGKLTWLMPLLGGQEIDDGHVAAVVNLTNYRNGFVHYKWHAAAEDDSGLEKAVERFQATVKHLVEYERTHFWGNSREVIQRILKR